MEINPEHIEVINVCNKISALSSELDNLLIESNPIKEVTFVSSQTLLEGFILPYYGGNPPVIKGI